MYGDFATLSIPIRRPSGSRDAARSVRPRDQPARRLTKRRGLRYPFIQRTSAMGVGSDAARPLCCRRLTIPAPMEPAHASDRRTALPAPDRFDPGHRERRRADARASGHAAPSRPVVRGARGRPAGHRAPLLFTPDWREGVPRGSSTLYDVFSGSLSGLLQGAGDYSSGACISASSYSPGFQDELSDPAPGEGVYYLARARNPCATGTFGTPGIDASAAQSTAPCP
jgi:hypothetical protein